MSLATATPSGQHSPNDDMGKSQTSTANGTPKADQVSRFVGGSGTPSENSPFPNQLRNLDAKHKNDEVKRAASMGNLVRRGSEMDDEEEEESALAPSRSRKSSTGGTTTPGGHAYNPPQTSRTQQKLWLQRASSNIEPQQMAPGVGIGIGIGSIGLGLHHSNSGFGNSLVGAGYDGKDPRVRLQLERTGLEYLVVRRHQDPVNLALERLRKLPGMEKSRRIPHPHQGHAQKKSDASGHTSGLSQSLRDARSGRGEGGKVGSGGRNSFEVGSQGTEGRSGDGGERDGEDGVGSILRGLWEKGYEMSASTD